MDRKVLNAWRPFLNVMQRLDMEIEIARTCQREPKLVRLGRKELYELKRDWGVYLSFVDDGKTPVHIGVGSPVVWLELEQVNETEWLEVV